MIEQERPNCYIETRWENREGYPFDQPYKYCNDVKVTSEMVNTFKDRFSSPFDVALHESRCFEKALIVTHYNSTLWKTETIKNKAFNKIYNRFVNKQKGQGGEFTPLFLFEIYLLNDGFEIVELSGLTANDPYYRLYTKENYLIYIGFGIIIRGRTTKFYFNTNKSSQTFQVDNNVENYQKAINGKLKSLESIENYD